MVGHVVYETFMNLLACKQVLFIQRLTINIYMIFHRVPALFYLCIQCF
jgi:hypothetical protein